MGYFSSVPHRPPHRPAYGPAQETKAPQMGKECPPRSPPHPGRFPAHLCHLHRQGSDWRLQRLVSQIELAQYVTEIRREVENYSRPILIDPGKPQDTIALDRREVKWFWHALAKATSPSVRKVRP
jgi:hypothetical protein